MMGLLKKIAKSAIFLFIKIVFNPGTRYLIRKVNKGFLFFYSLYKSADFEHVGEGGKFEYPVVLKGGQYIKIGTGFSARARFRIEAWDFYIGNSHEPQIIIGDNVAFNFDCHLGAINKIQIGNNVLIGSHVLITDHNHGKISIDEIGITPSLRPLFSKGPVVIEDNVWIGEGVAVLPGVKIGKNSIIGANSVVSMDIPENCVAGGIPARVIKHF